jgi:hypothetical protein
MHVISLAAEGNVDADQAVGDHRAARSSPSPITAEQLLED